MKQIRFWMVPAVALLLAATQFSVASAQQRGGRGFMGRGTSLLGLLNVEAVQKELELSDDAIEKIEKASEKIFSGMREKYAELRDIDSWEERLDKMEELGREIDKQGYEELGEGLMEREQFIRLMQIALQVRGPVRGLNNEFVANRLELTEEQKTKLAKIKSFAAKVTGKTISGLRDASQEDRQAAFGKLREIREKSSEKALGVLTEDQKEQYEEMLGEEFEMPSRGR